MAYFCITQLAGLRNEIQRFPLYTSMIFRHQTDNFHQQVISISSDYVFQYKKILFICLRIIFHLTVN